MNNNNNNPLLNSSNHNNGEISNNSTNSGYHGNNRKVNKYKKNINMEAHNILTILYGVLRESEKIKEFNSKGKYDEILSKQDKCKSDGLCDSTVKMLNYLINKEILGEEKYEKQKIIDLINEMMKKTDKTFSAEVFDYLFELNKPMAGGKKNKKKSKKIKRNKKSKKKQGNKKNKKSKKNKKVHKK